MKIQYASDLHLEFPFNNAFVENYPIIPNGDMLILAGDTCYYLEEHFGNPFFDKISQDFREVYIVPGNHEFYGHGTDLAETIPSFENQIRSNVTFLNNKVVKFEGVRILFTTLFSHVDEKHAPQVGYYLNDFRVTKYSGRNYSVQDFNSCHDQCVSFLKEELSKEFDGKTIVVSHFPPFSKEYIEGYPRFQIDLSQYFHAHLEWLINAYHIDHWISGHTHINFDSFQIGNTWMHSNMLGYVQNGEHKRFQVNKTLDL